MLSIKSELAGEDLLNEDQMATAELVAAAAEVETVGGDSRSGTPIGSSISGQVGGQRIIQVIQRSSNFSGGIPSSRLGHVRPLQQVQLSGGSLNNYNTNTALQYQSGLSTIGAASSVLKSSPGMEFGSAKILSGGSLFTTTLSSGFSGSQASQFSMGVPIGSNNVAAAAAAASAATAASQPPNVPQGPQSRKPCNCNKSHCLKLYCDCFAQGQLCQNCNCTNCMNNLQYEEERARAIKMTLDRNPMAFHPKIGRGEGERKHTKGCNCKKSGCLKNYCECYEAKISCTELCRCQGCKNTEDGMERRSLMRLSIMNQAIKSRQQIHSRKSFVGPAPETYSSCRLLNDSVNGNVTDDPVREDEDYESAWNPHPTSSVYWDRTPSSSGVVGSSSSAFHRYTGFYGADVVGEPVTSSALPTDQSLTNDNSFGIDELTGQPQDDHRDRGFSGGQMTSATSHSFCDPFNDGDTAGSTTSEDALPHTFITWEVAEACCGCMLAQADDAERRDMLPAAQERIILEEFGRCLGQIVESASKAQPLPGYAPNASVSLPLSSHMAGGLGIHRLPPGGMGDMELSDNRLHHEGSLSGGDENVIVDV